MFTVYHACKARHKNKFTLLGENEVIGKFVVFSHEYWKEVLIFDAKIPLSTTEYPKFQITMGIEVDTESAIALRSFLMKHIKNMIEELKVIKVDKQSKLDDIKRVVDNTFIKFKNVVLYV